MAIEIKKPIDRALLKEIIHDFDLYALWDTLKDQTIIDVEEDYTRCLVTDPGALLVIDDSTTTPGTGEVGLSVVLPFILDITVGEYVYHTDEQSHIGTMRLRKYALREDSGMTDEEIEKMWDTSAKDTTAYKNLIQDNTISSTTLWSSQKIDSEIQSSVTTTKEYVNNLIGSHATLKMEVVTSLPTNPSEGVLYIYNNGTGFPIYIYSSTLGWIATGADIQNIPLNNYFEKKNVVTDTSTVSDDTVLSSKAIKKYVDNLSITSAIEPTDMDDGNEWIQPY